MASLQARHQRHCPLYPWTAARRATAANGCCCRPLYYVVFRYGGRLIREPAGHNRRLAQRAADARRGDLARRDYRLIEPIPFEDWASRWLGSLQTRETTRKAYEGTLAYAVAVFGRRPVRDLSPADIRRFLAQIGERARGGEPSAATLAKHLRQLGACLQAAVVEGYAAENPVRRLHRTARPRVPRPVPAYYTDDELARLWPELAHRPVILALCKTATGTGMRAGELFALTWGDIDLLRREIHVQRTLTPAGIQPPKGGATRVVDLVPPVAAILEEWWRQQPGDDTRLVFPREDGKPLTSRHVVQTSLYPALARAGIPRVGERGRPRNFHSFRHTFARRALEAGAEITWVQRQLGHSSITLTVDTYGRWQRTAEKNQAERLAPAFQL